MSFSYRSRIISVMATGKVGMYRLAHHMAICSVACAAQAVRCLTSMHEAAGWEPQLGQSLASMAMYLPL